MRCILAVGALTLITACGRGPVPGDGGAATANRSNDSNTCTGTTSVSESNNCTVLTSSAGTITDGNGNTWQLGTASDGSYAVELNGAPAGFTIQVIKLVYVNHTVAQENVANDWWSWTGDWTSIGDPTASCAGNGQIFSAGSGEEAAMADALVDSIGVNAHFTYGDTNWGADRDSLIIPGLAQLGARHVRDALDINDASAYPIYADVYETVKSLTGTVVSFDLLLPYPSQIESCNVGNIDLSTMKSNMPLANIDSLEGINEWNGFSNNAGLGCGNAWQDDLRTSQPALFAAVHGDSQLSAIKVLGPALAFWGFDQLQSDAAGVGDLSQSMDYGAEHSYCGGGPPSSNISGYHDAVTVMEGTRSAFTVTETGYYTLPDGAQGISEQAHGKYMSRLFFEYFNAGSIRTYVYDLIDDTWNSGSEANFGLLRGDGTFKPGATAIANIITILGDLGPAFTPGRLDYSLGGAPQQLHHTLLQKRDGTMYLVLWQEVPSYDTGAQNDVGVAPVTVALDLGQTFSAVNQYDPTSSASAVTSASNVRTLNVDVFDQALIVEIKP